MILALLFALVSTACVSEEQCEEIRLNANYWKEAHEAYHDADLIEDRLWLGNVCAAHNEAWLRANNITLVLSMAMEWPVTACEVKIERQSYDMDDTTREDEETMRRILDEASLVVSRHLAKNQGSVLVHCNMGISRSASVVIRYLQRKYPHRSFRKLLLLLKTRRPVVRPNNLFSRILIESRPEL